MPKILIAESLEFETLENIAKKEHLKIYKHHANESIPDDGFHLFYQPDISVHELEEALNAYDALVVRPKEVTAKAIKNAPNLKLIVRGGAGMNSIDLKACKEQNVTAENTPGANSVSTAEYTFALIMEVVARRQIHRADADTRTGKPEVPEDYTGRELAGKTLAIIGFGNIGEKVAKRAEAFDMNVIYNARNKKDVPYKYFDDIHELLKQQPDIISLHAPLTLETENMIGNEEFALMKQGTILINAARPQLIEPDAFIKALHHGRIGSFAIDGDLELVEIFAHADKEWKGVITHHIADSTIEAQSKITQMILYQLLAFFRDNKIINQVTL